MNHKRALILPRRFPPLSSCLTEKDKGTKEQPFLETAGMRGISKTLIKKNSTTKQSTRQPETWLEEKKKTLIIKCCLCKMKNHTVPSGHNSPGKPSMYVTRQEAKLMHRGGAAAAHANSTSKLLCKAHSPCMAFHVAVRYLTKFSALTEDNSLSHFH